MADLGFISTEATQASVVSGVNCVAVRQLDGNGDPITSGGWLVAQSDDYGFISDWVPEMFFINAIDGMQLLKVRWTTAKVEWMMSQYAVGAGNTTGCAIHVRTPKP